MIQTTPTDRDRVERELQIAREIQLGFLPQAIPNWPGWQIVARFVPAYEVAGDFYDVFYMTNKTRVGFVVADVCDKGVGAALFMGLSRSLLRAFAQQNYSANWADVLGEETRGRNRRLGKTAVGVTALRNAITLTNDYIANNHSQANMFASMFVGVLDPETGAVNYVNAGHPPALILDAHNAIKARLTRTAAPVGAFPGVEFRIEPAQLEPGDTLLMFTDGVVEAKSPADEIFSDERLEDLLRHAPQSPAGLLDTIQAAVRQHADTAPQSDDITLLAIQRAE